jgi:hypothetical protein
LEFDKEPGHDKLKVSWCDDLVVFLIWREGGADELRRKRRIRCLSRCLCTILLRRTTLGGRRGDLNFAYDLLIHE